MKKPFVNEILTQEYFENVIYDFFNYYDLLIEVNQKKAYNFVDVKNVHIDMLYEYIQEMIMEILKDYLYEPFYPFDYNVVNNFGEFKIKMDKDTVFEFYFKPIKEVGFLYLPYKF